MGNKPKKGYNLLIILKIKKQNNRYNNNNNNSNKKLEKYKYFQIVSKIEKSLISNFKIIKY